MESEIQFSNERGELLRGLLHSPESSNPAGSKNLVIFPNCGAIGCEGDYRSYVSMARQLARGGYYVMRFSPKGLGYSDGYIPACHIKTFFGQIEEGLFVGDIKAAVKFARVIENFSSITLSGICGGAISSFLATAELKGVGYVIPIGIPVILDSDDMDYNARLPADEAKLRIKTYYDKLFSAKAWARLLFGKSDIAPIRAAIFALFHRKASYITEENEKAKFAQNPLFFEAARRIFKARKKVLFVFGDTDGFWWEFQRLFLKKHYDGVKETPFDLYLSPRANHMLNLPEMQLDVVRAMLTWMRKHHARVS